MISFRTSEGSNRRNKSVQYQLNKSVQLLRRQNSFEKINNSSRISKKLAKNDNKKDSVNNNTQSHLQRQNIELQTKHSQQFCSVPAKISKSKYREAVRTKIQMLVKLNKSISQQMQRIPTKKQDKFKKNCLKGQQSNPIILQQLNSSYSQFKTQCIIDKPFVHFLESIKNTSGTVDTLSYNKLVKLTPHKRRCYSKMELQQVKSHQYQLLHKEQLNAITQKKIQENKNNYQGQGQLKMIEYFTSFNPNGDPIQRNEQNKRNCCRTKNLIRQKIKKYKLRTNSNHQIFKSSFQKIE